MSNVIVNREKIDILANAISDKSGVPVTMTLDEMVEAVDSIETGGGEPSLQAKTYTVDSAGTETITADSGYDGLSEVEVSVPTGSVAVTTTGNFITINGTKYFRFSADAGIDSNNDMGTEGYISDHTIVSDYDDCSIVPSGTSVTPTESAQTIGGLRRMMEGAVTVNAIPSNYVGSGITQRSSSDLTASGATVTVPSGYYSAQASKAVASGSITNNGWSVSKTHSSGKFSVEHIQDVTGGYVETRRLSNWGDVLTLEDKTVTPTTSQQVVTPTSTAYYLDSVTVNAMPTGTAGTPTATKGTVSNHSVSVTPSVINTAGYISGGTKTGTAVTVSASELVSGSQTLSDNGDYDVTNLASVTINVSGGGGSMTQTDWIAVQSSMTTSTLTYTGLKGEPTSFIITIDDDLATGSPAKVAAVVFDGTNLHGQTVTNTSNAQASYDTGFTKSYSNGTLTVTATNAQFQSIEYCLAYTYGGSAGDVYTKDVQVGSGATSITFSNLEDEPIWWSCIFKSNFSTSSGYQRVMYVTKNVSDGNVFGMCLDSSGHNVAYWTATYNNGSFTITSQGTNQGGYFHQPGYYQLTYAVTGGDGNYQSKTVTPTTSQQVVEADSGYDALKRVTVNAMPSGSTTAPASISGTAASISTGTNTLTLTKTVSVTPTVSAGYVSAGTAGNSSISLTASVTTKAAATITPTTTNQTIAAGTYLTGAQTIAGDADLVGGNILSTANIFGVQGTVVIQNYYTGSSAPSSSTGSNGDLYLQS